MQIPIGTCTIRDHSPCNVLSNSEVHSFILHTGTHFPKPNMQLSADPAPAIPTSNSSAMFNNVLLNHLLLDSSIELGRGHLNYSGIASSAQEMTSTSFHQSFSALLAALVVSWVSRSCGSDACGAPSGSRTIACVRMRSCAGVPCKSTCCTHPCMNSGGGGIIEFAHIEICKDGLCAECACSLTSCLCWFPPATVGNFRDPLADRPCEPCQCAGTSLPSTAASRSSGRS